MPTISRLNFDERHKKYSHLCCHIRIAALVIACLQMISFVYDIGNFVVYNLHNWQKSDVSDGYSRDAVDLDAKDGADDDGYEWIRKKGIIVGLVWDCLVSLSVLLTLCGLRKIKPLYLVPQLIMYAATVAICFIMGIILVVIAFRALYFDHLWVYILIVAGAGCLYSYCFHIVVRTFRYLSDKRRFLNDTTNIYVVPMGNGIDSLPHDPYDVPPAYPGLLANPNGAGSGADNKDEGDKVEEDKLPSYEEAQKLKSKENCENSESVENRV